MSVMLETSNEWSTNLVKTVNAWETLSSAAVIEDTTISLPNGASAATALAGSGLASAARHKLKIVFSGVFTQAANKSSENAVQALFKYRYYRNGSLHLYVAALDLTLLNCDVEGDGTYVYTYETIFRTPEVDAQSASLQVLNASGAAGYLIACELRKSIDIQPSQIAASIQTSISLKKVEEYTDGFRIYFANDTEPLQLEKLEDSETGDFVGFRVNDEQDIPWVKMGMPL
jgi:hypothetical protein